MNQRECIRFNICKSETGRQSTIRLHQWFPNCGSREVLQFFTISSLLFIFLFPFADVDISQSTLDIWFHMLICIVIMCCVFDSLDTKLHANKLIDTSLKILETAHPSAVSKSRNYM